MAITINGTGTITGISAGGLPDGVITSADLASGAITTAGLPAGSILQVVSTTKTDVFSSSSGTFVDVTGLSVDITPSSTSSKILILATLIQSNSGSTVIANLVRDSTTIAQPDGSPTIPGTVNLTSNNETNLAPSNTINFLDSPSTTSSTTYKIQIRREAGGVTYYINRRHDSSDHAYVSTITAMEVAG